MRRRAFRTILRVCCRRDEAAADHGVAFVENGRLPPGDSVDRLVELELEATVHCRNPCSHSRRAVTKLRLRPVDLDVEAARGANAPARERLPRADDDPVRGRVRLED